MTDEATLKALIDALIVRGSWDHETDDFVMRGNVETVARVILAAEPRLTLVSHVHDADCNGPDPDEVREMADGELSVIHHPEHTPGCKDGECRTCEGPLMAKQERLAAIGAAVERLGTDYTVNARRGYVTVRTYRGDSMHVEHFGQFDTLPAAVNAALEDKP